MGKNTITQKKDEHNFRWYTVDGIDYISVTTALDVIMDQQNRDFLLNVTRAKYDTIMGNTSEIGTKIHDAVEYCYKNNVEVPEECDEISKDALPALNLYREFVETKGIKHLDFEIPVYSKTYGYAGKLDSIIEIDGKKYICDLKTGRFNFKHGFQVQAYRRAAIEMGLVDESVGSCIIYVHRSGEQKVAFCSHRQHDFLFEQFLAALWLHQGLYPNQWRTQKDSPYQWNNPAEEYFAHKFGMRPTPEDFPGFEGTAESLDNLTKFGVDDRHEKMD